VRRRRFVQLLQRRVVHHPRGARDLDRVMELVSQDRDPHARRQILSHHDADEPLSACLDDELRRAVQAVILVVKPQDVHDQVRLLDLARETAKGDRPAAACVQRRGNPGDERTKSPR
jgi:hypothetical protein